MIGRKYSVASRYDREIYAAASEFGIPASVLKAVCWVESRFNNAAVSEVGAVSAFQVMPDTARSLGFDPAVLRADVSQAARASAKYIRLSMQSDRVRSWRDVFAAYFSGVNGNWGTVKSRTYQRDGLAARAVFAVDDVVPWPVSWSPGLSDRVEKFVKVAKNGGLG